MSAPTVRRGLPRVRGGAPWPPGVDFAQPELSVVEPGIAEAAPVDVAPVTVRRGLPRSRGGEPWPGDDVVVRQKAEVTAAVAAEPAGAAVHLVTISPAGAVEGFAGERFPISAEHGGGAPIAPLPFRRTVWLGPGASARPRPRAEPKLIRGRTPTQWAGIVVLGGAALLFAAFMAVVFTRWFLSLDFMGDFLATYPGETHLPESAPVGIPAWLGWQHFFNVFLLVLIIRSGLQVRTQEKPPMYWSPRWNRDRKISITLWFHQSLDILWILNGAVFVVLLFVTGQWMRVVPTSWDVIPNAVSAALQYVSLDWPTENGWVNYNSLQVLAYFTTIFVAGPLAVVTGARMSGVWPKNATRLSLLYPVEWARAVHFPVMLYFVTFIVVHVTLVMATGALRNLNHMYAANGSPDPSVHAENWGGFWTFFISLLVIVGGWAAARPLILCGIARAFGTVSAR